ncbi:MAG: Zn-ribbon domain-containing OB-fold protein [Streptosporangiaceae bacterium]
MVPPEPGPDSRFFWDGLADGRLLLPLCRSCGHMWFPPIPCCPRCGGIDVGDGEAAGTGRLYSWVVTHHPFDTAYAEDVPYTVAVVTLDEGPRLVGRLFRADPAALVPDQPMRAVRYTTRGQPLLGFVPTDT